MGIERGRTPLEQSMFQLSKNLGVEVGFAELEVPGVGRIRRLITGEARSLPAWKSLFERPVTTFDEIAIQLPGGETEIIGRIEKEIPVSVGALKEIMHTHPVSGQAIFSSGDLGAMRSLANRSSEPII